MTRTVDLLSERVQAAGGFQGGGVLKLLGTPRMDELTLLVREAVQNSWDARWPSDSVGTVDFRFRVFTLSTDQRAAVRHFFASLPSSGSALAEVLQRSEIVVAEIRDGGTTGLDGPTRADRAATGARNFIDFIRNIGAPQDRDESGGTYGFGKGSYYRASDAHAIIVHTRCRDDGGTIESRLIGAAVGEPFLDGMTPRTGRHFWGVRDGSDDYVEPVTGGDADALAASIGMGVPEGSTGTSILVVGFRTGLDDSSSDEGIARTPLDAARHMAHQLVWQCWPKVVARHGVIPMRFSVECEGEEIEVPTLDAVPPLSALAETLRTIHAGTDGVIDIQSQKPRKQLGRLAFRTFSATDPRRGFGTEAAAGFEVPTHHTALLRSPELVVRYLPGPPSDLDDHGWIGVFLADSDVDGAFAAAEPPTHDDWVKDQVNDKRQRRCVNVALREIDKEVKARFAPARPDRPTTGLAVAGLASALGDIFRMPGLDSERTSATSGKSSSGRSTGRRSSSSIRQLTARLDLVDGSPAHVISLDPEAAAQCAALEAWVAIAVDDGVTEHDAPLGSAAPAVIGWLVDGRVVSRGPRLGPVPDGGLFEVAVERQATIVPLVTVTPAEGTA